MKRAKQRLPSILAKLISGARRSDHAITQALAAVRASEKRIPPVPKRSLVEMILKIPEGLPLDLDFENAPPVGREDGR